MARRPWRTLCTLAVTSAGTFQTSDEVDEGAGDLVGERLALCWLDTPVALKASAIEPRFCGADCFGAG